MYEAEHGMIDISECEWPAFLYPLGSSPDVEDDQIGLFRGYLLTQVGEVCPSGINQFYYRYFVRYSLALGQP